MHHNLQAYYKIKKVAEGVTKEDEQPFHFDVYGWDGHQTGEYEVYCTLGETSLSGTAAITVTEANVTCVAELSDAIQNPYQFTITATPKIPTKETITFTDMTITPDPWDWSDNITITAENDEHSIELILAGGKNKGYGEYGFADGYAEVYDVYLDYTLIDMAPNTVAVYSLDEENDLAKFEGTFINGIDTLVISMTGAPYVDPSTIVPTDTVNIDMYEGQIYMKYNMFLVVEGQNNDYNLAITLVDGDAHEGVTTTSFAENSILTVNADASQITFLYGTLTVNETDDTATAGLLGSDHVWYNIMVTTKEAPASAVDNITTNTKVSNIIPDENGLYLVSTNVAAAQMTEAIVIQVVTSEVEGNEYCYSVRKYGDYIIENWDDEGVIDLVKAMLIYGGAAQDYFAYNLDDMADANISQEIHKIPQYENVAAEKTGSSSKVTYYGSSLVHEHQTNLRFYFKSTDADISTVTFSASIGDVVLDSDMKVYKASGMYYVEVANIAPNDLCDMITISVDGFTVTYSPFYYMHRMYFRTTSSEELRNLVAAMYNYYYYAVEYLSN